MTQPHQRLLPRHRRRLKVSLEGAGPVFSTDLSAGGFCAELMKPPRRGSTLSGALELEGHLFPFTAEVRWVEEGDLRIHRRGRMGVRFTGIANDFFHVFMANTEQRTPGGPLRVQGAS